MPRCCSCSCCVRVRVWDVIIFLFYLHCRCCCCCYCCHGDTIHRLHRPLRRRWVLFFLRANLPSPTFQQLPKSQSRLITIRLIVINYRFTARDRYQPENYNILTKTVRLSKRGLTTGHEQRLLLLLFYLEIWSTNSIFTFPYTHQYTF